MPYGTTAPRITCILADIILSHDSATTTTMLPALAPLAPKLQATALRLRTLCELNHTIHMEVLCRLAPA